MRFQKLMWRNMMKSTKSKKVSVLHYSIDIYIYIYNSLKNTYFVSTLQLLSSKVFLIFLIPIYSIIHTKMDQIIIFFLYIYI